MHVAWPQVCGDTAPLADLWTVLLICTYLQLRGVVDSCRKGKSEFITHQIGF